MYHRQNGNLHCELETPSVQPALDVQSFEKLGLPMNDKKVMGVYHELSSYGAIAT